MTSETFLSLSHEQNAGKSYLRNPFYPSTKNIINLLSCLYFIELLSTGANQKSLKIPISANSFQLDWVLFSTIEILQVLHMTLQKLVANVRERFRATTSKSGSTLTLLTENIIYSIGKLLTISSRDAHIANQDKPLQKMVCSNIIKFYLRNLLSCTLPSAKTWLICEVAFLNSFLSTILLTHTLSWLFDYQCITNRLKIGNIFNVT